MKKENRNSTIFAKIKKQHFDRRKEEKTVHNEKKGCCFRTHLQNATHFVGVAYPPNKISKIALKVQAFYSYFMKFCLVLNSNKKGLRSILTNTATGYILCNVRYGVGVYKDE